MLLEKMQQYWMSILKNKKIFTRNYYKCKILTVILIILMVFTGCRQERITEKVQKKETVESAMYAEAKEIAQTFQNRYRPRGLYDCEFPYEPYPEVISYEKLHDGTLKLTIEAVWEIRMLDKAITSELIIKPMKDGSFQYLSNKVIKSDQNANAGWYMPRLTEEEWKANYSNN